MMLFYSKRGSTIFGKAKWFISVLCLLSGFFLFAPSVLTAREALVKEAISEYEDENYEEAQEILLRAKEALPYSSEAAYYLGLTYIQTGEYEEAARHLSKAAGLSPPVEEAFVELIDVLYNMGRIEEALSWIARAEKRGIKPARVAYQKGLVLIKRDKSEEAIEAFKNAKELDKGLTQQSNLQIALIYAKDNKFTLARESLKAVVEADPTSEFAALAREYEKNIKKIERAYRRLRLTVGAFYQYDDNVTLRPIDTGGLEIAGGKSDSSVVATARLTYRTFLEGPWILNLYGGLYSNTYFTESSHNLINSTLSVNPGYNFKKGAFTLPVSYSHLWLEGDDYMDLYGIKPTLSFMIIPNHIIQLIPGVVMRDVLTSPPNEDEDRDSIKYIASIDYILTFSEGRGMFNFGYTFFQDDTKGRNWENTGNLLDLNLLLPLTKTIRLTMSGDLLSQNYSQTHSTYNTKREDATYTGRVSLMWKVYERLDLILRYLHTTAESNISVYEYNRNVYSAGFEYSF